MSQGEQSLQDLKERTKTSALRIIRLYAVLPKTTEEQVIGKQVLRNGTSVGAHYREATRARSNVEFISPDDSWFCTYVRPNVGRGGMGPPSGEGRYNRMSPIPPGS